MKPTAVVVDGPYSAIRPPDFDEYPKWVVCRIDDDGCEYGEIWRCDTYDSAVEKGEQISEKESLELVVEAMRS